MRWLWQLLQARAVKLTSSNNWRTGLDNLKNCHILFQKQKRSDIVFIYDG